MLLGSHLPTSVPNHQDIMTAQIYKSILRDTSINFCDHKCLPLFKQMAAQKSRTWINLSLILNYKAFTSVPNLATHVLGQIGQIWYRVIQKAQLSWLYLWLHLDDHYVCFLLYIGKFAAINKKIWNIWDSLPFGYNKPNQANLTGLVA